MFIVQVSSSTIDAQKCPIKTSSSCLGSITLHFPLVEANNAAFCTQSQGHGRIGVHSSSASRSGWCCAFCACMRACNNLTLAGEPSAEDVGELSGFFRFLTPPPLPLPAARCCVSSLLSSSVVSPSSLLLLLISSLLPSSLSRSSLSSSSAVQSRARSG